MCGKTFILTDKIEFVPDKDLERELNFNFRATGYIFNKTLEASIYRENLVKEFGIGTEWECPHYHSILKRDINAAKNILDEGLHAAG
jgi:hypothetical protein